MKPNISNVFKATALTLLFLYSTVVLALGVDFWGRTHTNFVNWETPHVHPLELTPDGTTLLAVNTADNSLMIFSVNGSSIQQTGIIPVGLDPVSVRARTNNEIWVVNHISDTISIIDLTKMEVIATLHTDDEPADVVFAGSPQRAFVSASQVSRLNIFDPNNLNSVFQSVYIQGEDPRALAVSPDGNKVYAAIFESGNGTTIVTGGKANQHEVDLVRHPDGPYSGADAPPNDGANFKPALNPNNPAPPPVSIIVKKDNNGAWRDDNNGDWSRYITGDLADLAGPFGGRVQGWDLVDRDVAIVDTNTLTVTYQTRLMNTLMALAIHPTSGDVTVVGTEASNEIRWEPNLQGIFLRVNLARITSAGNKQITDLNPHLNYSSPSTPISERNKSLGDPRGIAWNAAGTRAYITGMGSNNVIAINQNGQRSGLINVGQGPTGIVLNQSGNRAFVLNKFSASISVLNLNTDQEIAQVAYFDPTPQAIKQGRRHLYATQTTSGLGHIACVSCHIDARTDRLAWDLGDPSGEMTSMSGINDTPPGDVITVQKHPMKGPLMTSTLQDIIGHETLHMSGDRPNIGHFAEAFVNLQGADAAISLTDVAEMETFLDSIHFPPNPFRELTNLYADSVEIPGPDGTIVESGNPWNGLQEFESNCRNCHFGHSGKGNLIRNGGEFGLGTIRRAPHWRNFHERTGLWFPNKTSSTSGFGFQQDGTFDSHQNHARSADMMALMLSFNGRFPYVPVGLNEGNQSKDTHAGVGHQIMFNGTVSSEDVNMLFLFSFMADEGWIGLVAKGTVDGKPRGYAYSGAGKFQSDRFNEILTLTEFINRGVAGQRMIFTAVPAGSETRIGIDRDLDGLFDGDESEQNTDPADPSQGPVVPVCQTTTNVAPAGSASQSSNLHASLYQAGWATDGNLLNFTHTQSDQNPASWIVNLDANYALKTIVLHNRPYCCQSRLRDITVKVFDETGQQATFKSHFLNRHNRNTGPDKITLDLVQLTGGLVQGKNVQVIRTPDPFLLGTNGVGEVDEINALSLAEVEVLACRPPKLTSPGNQTNLVNDNVNLVLSASDPDGDKLRFSASGLPNGLSINTNTGTISGIVNTAGVFNVSVLISDGTVNRSVNFNWNVN